MLQQDFGDLQIFFPQLGFDLQGIAGRLSPVMIVGDDISFLPLGQVTRKS